MSFQSDDPQTFAPVGDGPRIQNPPRNIVRLAAVIILAMGGVGLVRGITIGRPAAPDGSPLSVLAGVNPATTAAAKPAVIMNTDPNWSTLSGPHMADSSAKPKPVAKPVESDDEEDAESGSAAAKSAAADAIAPDAPDADAAPTAPAAPSASSTDNPPPSVPPT